MGYGWSWSWVNSLDDTANSSSAVTRGNSVAFSFRQATRGQTSASEINAAIGAITQNVRRLWSQWNTYSFPVLNSLPAGGKDNRWGTPLRKEIDCFSFGVAGSTLFVFNDAASGVADGRYWHTDEARPKTIAEVFEDLYEIAAASESDLTSLTSSVDLDPLWEAIGNRYENSSLSSTPTSLDARTFVIEGHISQLNTDIYGLNGEGFTTYHLGSPLNYSIVKHLDRLLKIHDVAGGWHNDPADMDHDDLTALLLGHTHPQTEVHNLLNTATLGRGLTATLEDDVKRIRWEIDRTRGGIDWQNDVSDPWDPGDYTTLGKHVGYTGGGASGINNPHGIDYNNTGADAVFDDVFTFLTGNVAHVSFPTYTSTNFIVQNSDIETAISALDGAMGAAGGIFEVHSGTFSGRRKDTDCTAVGDYSLALGRDANANLYGEVAQASGQISCPLSGFEIADGQTTVFTLYGTTIGDGTTEMLAPDTSRLEDIVVPENSVWTVKVTLLGRGSQTAGVTNAYHTIWDFTVANEVGQDASIVGGGVTEAVITNTFSGVTETLVDIQANGRLLISTETNSGDVAYWAAKVETVQISVVAPEDLGEPPPE